VADSILTSAAKKIRDAIETARNASSFELTAFELDYDYDGRDVEGLLDEGKTYVTVVVPQRYLYVGRVDRTQLGRVAAFDIDIRQKFSTGQQANASLVEKQQIDRVIRLGEQIHAIWETLELTDYGLVGEWIAQERNLEAVSDREKSMHLATYVEEILASERIIYGICREVFLFTAGTV
jgi:hypothetical protein